MLDEAAPDQRQLGHRAVLRSIPGGCEEITHQPRQKGRQIGKLVAHLRCVIHRVLQNLSEIPGKHIGEDRGAFDQSGVSKTCLFAGEVVPLDEDHVPSPFLQVQGGANADHACAQYEDICLEFRHPALRKLNVMHSLSLLTLTLITA